MQNQNFEALKAQLATELSAHQCLELIGLLQKQAHSRLSEIAVQRRTEIVTGRRKCVHCGHTDIVKHGQDENKRQRFRCRKSGAVGCGKTYNIMTGTVLARMRHPGKWVGYAAEMANHKSIVELSASNLGVSRLTAWRWRQKLLSVQVSRGEPPLKGVVEADETYFLTSYKGSRGWKNGHPPENRRPRYRGGPATKAGLSGEQVPVVTAIDRNGRSIDKVVSGRTEIGGALVGRIAPGSVLCTDGLAAYKSLATLCQSEHRRIRAPKKKNYIAKAKGGQPRQAGRLGLGMVNGHHERIKTFVNRQARGVSTRYLPAYLSWLRAIRRPGFTTADLLTDILIHS